MDKVNTYLFDKFGITVYSDWIQFLGPKAYNWLDFTFVNLSIEYDYMFGNLGIETGLLGFNLRWVISVARPNKSGEEVIRMAEEVTANSTESEKK